MRTRAYGSAQVAIRPLRRNLIHDGKAGGVFFQDYGQGTLEDNDIFQNAYSGVEIRSGGNPTLRRNRIHDGKSAGVLVWDNGQGTLEDNDIFANAYSGVEIKTAGNPALRRNRIHDGKVGGVLIWDKGQGALEDNNIFQNAYSGAGRSGAAAIPLCAATVYTMERQAAYLSRQRPGDTGRQRHLRKCVHGRGDQDRWQSHSAPQPHNE